MSSLKLRPDNSDNCLIFRETTGPPVFMTPRRLTSSRNPALHDDDLPLNSNLKYHSCHSTRSLNTCCTPHYCTFPLKNGSKVPRDLVSCLRSLRKCNQTVR